MSKTLKLGEIFEQSQLLSILLESSTNFKFELRPSKVPKSSQISVRTTSLLFNILKNIRIHSQSVRL